MGMEKNGKLKVLFGDEFFSHYQIIEKVKMKIKFLIGILALVLAISLVSSLETKIVETTIDVDYKASGCLMNCTNSTEGNITTQTCTNICKGILTITGENLLKEFQIGNENFHEILENNVVRTFGNESDITSLVEEMKKWREYEKKYNQCLDSNRNISAKMILCEDDKGAKGNLTKCEQLKQNLNSQLNLKLSEITDLKQEIEDKDRAKFLYGALGIALGILLIKEIIPRVKGKVTPKDETSELPPNIPY